MKLSLLSFLCIALLFVNQISGKATTIQPQLVEVLLSRRADEAATQGGHHGSTNTATSNTTTTATKGKGNTTIWASPAILQDGTLFYIAISISTLLWCTGKAANMSLDQQERRAEFLSRR